MGEALKECRKKWMKGCRDYVTDEGRKGLCMVWMEWIVGKG